MEPKIDALGELAGGWGSLKGVASILVREPVALAGTPPLAHQNKPDGFACVSCAWAKPSHPHPAEFCENGARMFTPGGFHRPLPVRHRRWKTETGRANFIKPSALDAPLGHQAVGSKVPASKSIPVRVRRMGA